MPNIVAKVVALKPHTAFGQSHDTGDTYELDEEFVANVLAQGMVRREDATDVPPVPMKAKPNKVDVTDFTGPPVAKKAKAPTKTRTKQAKPLKAKIRGTAAKKKKR